MEHETNLEWMENTVIPVVAQKSKESEIFADNVSFLVEKGIYMQFNCLYATLESN